MESQFSLIDGLRRTAHLGGALLEATAKRPAAPLKLNFALTYWCQYAARPATSGSGSPPTIDHRRSDIASFARTNVTWLDLTGGEIFSAPDIDGIFDAVVTGWRRLAILRLPTMDS
jgi:hypothetical protein